MGVVAGVGVLGGGACIATAMRWALPPHCHLHGDYGDFSAFSRNLLFAHVTLTQKMAPKV